MKRLCSVVLLLLVSLPAFAQEKEVITHEKLWLMKRVGAPVLRVHPAAAHRRVAHEIADLVPRLPRQLHRLNLHGPLTKPCASRLYLTSHITHRSLS